MFLILVQGYPKLLLPDKKGFIGSLIYLNFIQASALQKVRRGNNLNTATMRKLEQGDQHCAATSFIFLRALRPDSTFRLDLE